MNRKLNQQQLEFYRYIHNLLLTKWDPCGVKGVREARDEYDSYTAIVFSRALSGERAEEIAQFLLYVEQELMGLGGARKLCLSVAEQIVMQRNSLINDNHA